MFLFFLSTMEYFKSKQRLEILIWEEKILIIGWWTIVQLNFTKNIKLISNPMPEL